MKTISKLFTLLLLVAISISYVSCGGDDNETIINPNEQPNNNGNNNNNNNNDDTEEASIVGTWKYVFDNYDDIECYCLFIFEENGEGYVFEQDCYDGIADWYAEKIVYEYDYPLLTVYYLEYGDKENIKIDFINENTFESDWDEEETIWKRQKTSYDDTSIIGYWQEYDWDWVNEKEGYICGYRFDNNGKGVMYDMSKNHTYKADITYKYDAPMLKIVSGIEKISTIKFISNDIYLSNKQDSYEVEIFVRSDEPNNNDDDDDEISLVGSWTIVMDDPSWKTVIELKSNGQCVAKDYYDIEGDETFSEYSGTFSGTYEVTSKGIEFIFDEDDCSIIMGEYTFDTLTDDYFDAYDSDDWYIYATKN